jgi:hypothetical protein
MGHWWGEYWIWAALGVLVFLGLTMNLFGWRPFKQIRVAVERAAATDGAPSDKLVKEQELAAALRSFHPMPLALSGGLGLAILLWLMLFKPF